MSIEYSGLTLSQKAFVNFNSLRDAGKWLLIIISGIILLNGLAIIAWQYIEIKVYKEFVFGTIITSLILCIYVMAWSAVKAPRAYKKLREWEEDYVNSAYVLIFNTTIPKGNTTGEKVLNLAKMVFPQLRPDLFASPLDKPTFSGFVKALLARIADKKDISTETMNSGIYDYNLNGINLDVALKTDFGYFIVKDFGEKEVTMKDIHGLAKGVGSHFRVFRILCVAKTYDNALNTESLENNFNTIESRVDLLVKEKKGYSIFWIS